MGTRLTLHLRGETISTLERACTRAFDEVARLEQVFSNWRQDSELSRFNERAVRGRIAVSEDLFSILDASRRLSAETGGAFDVTVEPLVRAYDLRGTGRIPTPAELRVSLEAVGYRALSLDPSMCRAGLDSPNAGVDLGGIGKGYALDRVAAILRDEKVESAWVNFGGEVFALGEAKPGEPWEVAIADPFDRDRVVARVRVRDAAVSTSGQSERSLAVSDRQVGHVLDPRTGLPVLPWGSATVIASSATRADALSTALLVMGPQDAIAWTQRQDDLAAVLLERTPAGSLAVRTAGRAEGLVSFGTLASGQTPAPASTEAPGNEELARRIDILAEEIEEMRLGQVTEADSSVLGLAPGASKAYRTRQGVSIGGYGEILYENFSREREDDAPSGKTDQIDVLRAIFYLGYKFDPQLVFNSEIEFEHATTDREGSVSVEFANLDYRIDPRLNLRVGLLLAPLGWINELHEPPVFFGTRRPDVELYVIPSTWRGNGAGIVGEFPIGLRYRAYVMEGLRADGFRADNGLRGGRQSGSRATAENLAISGRLDWDGPLGFRIGGSFFHGNSGQSAILEEDLDIGTSVIEVHGSYQGHGLRARALHAQVGIDDVDKLNRLLQREADQSIGEEIVGTYVEAGYDLFSLTDSRRGFSVIPYARYETYNTQQSVPAGYASSPANEREVLTLGAALYPHPQVVVKGDWQKRTNKARTGVNQWNLAAGFLF